MRLHRPGLIALRIIKAWDAHRWVAVGVAEVNADGEHPANSSNEQVLRAGVGADLVAQSDDVLPPDVVRLEIPDGTEMIAANVRCLDDIDLDSMKPMPFDGRSL